MSDWSYLSALLDKVQSHSTVVGKVWMSVLFLFRILVLGAAADDVWEDEHTEFYCNTLEPGCQHACYDWKFPMSYVRYWVLQIVFVTTPTLVYMGYAVHVVHKEKRLRERQQCQTDGSGDGRNLKKPKYTDDRGKVKLKGVLLRCYLVQLLFKILLEAAFAVGQYYVFRSVFVDSLFHCRQDPCSVTSGSECYVSRPTEKSIFIVFMLVVAGVSVLLSVAEIFYLLCGRKRAAEKSPPARQRGIALPMTHSADPSSSMRTASVSEHHRGGGAFTRSPLPRDLVDISHNNTCTDF